MLLPRFELHRPRTVEDAVKIATEVGDFDWLGGGTDLLPNYKCRLNVRPHVIMLHDVEEMRVVSPTRIGAFARLIDVEESAVVREKLPGLYETVREIASPLLRANGTVGGNLCLDTRCYYFNQSDFWRDAKGGCLKEGGATCLVVPQQKIDVCWAAYSGDLAPMLQVLGASATIAGASGRRSVPLTDFFQPDGIRRNVLEKGDLLAFVEIPERAQRVRTGYMKLRQRDAIDFPILGVAAALDLDSGGAIADLRVSVTAVAVTPVFFDLTSERGKKPTHELIERVAAHVQKSVQPVKNVSLRPTYRKKMAGVFTRRLLERLFKVAS